MDLVLGAFVLGLVGLVVAARFGLLGTRAWRDDLARLAADRGFVLNGDGTGFEAVLEGIRVSARSVITPGHLSPSLTWLVEASARRPVAGVLTWSPKHEDSPGDLRVGHLDFDVRFLVEGTSRRVAVDVLSQEARAALIAFGPRGESSYEDGKFRFKWEASEMLPVEDIDRALAIALAICRAPGDYRGS